MIVSVTCKGTRPLLVHNGQASSPLHPYAKASKIISSKRKKTDEDYLELARLDFESSLYFDPPLHPNKKNNGKGIGPYIPAQNLYMSLINGARIVRLGKAIERGVISYGDIMLPLIYDGPRTIKELWGNGESKYVDTRPVKVGQSKVDRCRAIFSDWAIEAEFLIDLNIIDYEQFEEVTRLAGQMVGIGDYRLLYGKFEATCKKLQ